MAEAATPVRTEDPSTYEEAPPLPRYPTGIRDSIPTGEPIPTTPVDPSTGPPKFPSLTDVGLSNAQAASDNMAGGKLQTIREDTEVNVLTEYREVEEVGEDGETETARVLRREAERENREAEEIHELIRKNQVPVGTGEKLAHEAGEKEWTRDDQVELDKLLREDSDDFIPRDDEGWRVGKKKSESSIVPGVTRLSSEPRLVSRKELLERGQQSAGGVGAVGGTVVTETITTKEVKTMEVVREGAPVGGVSEGLGEDGTPLSDIQTETTRAGFVGVPGKGELLEDIEYTPVGEGRTEEIGMGTMDSRDMGREDYDEERDSRDMKKMGAAAGLGAVAGAGTGAYLASDEPDQYGKFEREREPEERDEMERTGEPREYEDSLEEVKTPTRGDMILKDEVVPQTYTSTYTEYHSKMGARVDVTHDYGLSGGHASGVEDVVFLDMDTLITAGTDGKVCIWDLNERYVKTEFEPYEDAEPVSMIQLMPSGAGAKGINFLTLSKNTRIMRIWNVVGDNAILMRSMQIPASKNDLVMSLPVFSPSKSVYPAES